MDLTLFSEKYFQFLVSFVCIQQSKNSGRTIDIFADGATISAFTAPSSATVPPARCWHTADAYCWNAEKSLCALRASQMGADQGRNQAPLRFCRLFRSGTLRKMPG